MLCKICPVALSLDYALCLPLSSSTFYFAYRYDCSRLYSLTPYKNRTLWIGLFTKLPESSLSDTFSLAFSCNWFSASMKHLIFRLKKCVIFVDWSVSLFVRSLHLCFYYNFRITLNWPRFSFCFCSCLFCDFQKLESQPKNLKMIALLIILFLKSLNGRLNRHTSGSILSRWFLCNLFWVPFEF